MPRTASYAMFCPVARALDVLGDRWTLLIMRDLVNGERRFTDLRSSVVGIPPNLLSQRLKALVEAGLVTTRELPAPAARTVYAATDEGMTTVPILRALVRFGMPRLPNADERSNIAAGNAVAAAVLAYYREDATIPDEHYELIVDGEHFIVTSARGGSATRPAEAPSATIAAPSWLLMNLRTGATSWDEALASGHLEIGGSKRAVRNFRRVFQLA